MENGRTIIIGDIHGCYDAFQKIIAKTEFNSETDRLIILGDLMDRGSQSWEVLQEVIRLKKDMKDQCVIIRGNHEDMYIKAVLYGKDFVWRMNGREATVASFIKNGDDYHNYGAWVRDNTVFYYSNGYFTCVHGGLPNGLNPENASPDELMWDRSCVYDNSYAGMLLIVGHTPCNFPCYFDGSGKESGICCLEYENELELPDSGLICLDTGAFATGNLTAMVIEGRNYRLVTSMD